MKQLLFSLLTACITALLAAWLTARFALRRFYSEKVWERKADAYTAIFDSLHDMCEWFGKHQDASEKGRELPEDVRVRLASSYKEAEAKLARDLDRQAWLLSPVSIERLIRMLGELDRSTTDWVDYLETGWVATNSALEDVRTLARKDLEIERGASSERLLVKLETFATKLRR